MLLDEGHLWCAKQVAIPIEDVAYQRDGVRLGLTKDQVGALPAVTLVRLEEAVAGPSTLSFPSAAPETG